MDWQLGQKVLIEYSQRSVLSYLKYFTFWTQWLLKHFGHFGGFQSAWIMRQLSFNLIRKVFATDLDAFLSLTSHFEHICLGMHINKKWRKWPTSAFFNCSFAFPFSPFAMSFLQWLTYWAPCQFKNFWENTVEIGNFYHGVAKFSRKEFFCEFFTHRQINLSIFVHMLGFIKLITLILVSLKM